MPDFQIDPRPDPRRRVQQFNDPMQHAFVHAIADAYRRIGDPEHFAAFVETIKNLIAHYDIARTDRLQYLENECVRLKSLVADSATDVGRMDL